MNRRETIDLLGRLKALCDDPARSDRVVRVLTSASLSIAIDRLNGVTGADEPPLPPSLDELLQPLADFGARQ